MEFLLSYFQSCIVTIVERLPGSNLQNHANVYNHYHRIKKALTTYKAFDCLFNGEVEMGKGWVEVRADSSNTTGQIFSEILCYNANCMCTIIHGCKQTISLGLIILLIKLVQFIFS